MLNARQVTEWRCQIFFRAGEIFWNKDTSIRISTTIHETKVLQGPNVEDFCLFLHFYKETGKAPPTISYKISETSSSFRVKESITGKV